jgi:predicted regulator of Ras-like GTPase activity (Roadblock/LC7/MglB family)
MSFRDIIKEIVERVDGGIGAVILGYDGIAIDEYLREQGGGFDFQLLAVEYATLLKEVKRTVEVLKTGKMEEVSITTGSTRIVIRALNDEFFIVLALEKGGNFGKGRYLLQRAAPLLCAELQ